MSRSLASVCAVFVGLVSGIGVEAQGVGGVYPELRWQERATWDTDAFSLFAEEVARGASNQANADAVTTLLRQTWSSVGEFFVAVNDDKYAANITFLGNSTAGEGDAVSRTFGGKNMFAMVLAKGVTDLCGGAINTSVLDAIMNLSVPSASAGQPETIVQAVSSFKYMNTIPQGIFVSADSSSVGFSNTFTLSTPCTYRYTSSPWFVFAWAYEASGPVNYEFYSHATLLSNLMLAPTMANEDLAQEVRNVLVTIVDPASIWAVMINDAKTTASATTAYEFSDFGETANWGSSAIESRGFCGKNMIVVGGTYAGNLDCSNPPINYYDYFEYIASTAVAVSGANTTSVIDAMDDADTIIGVQGKLIIVAKDSKAGIKYSLSPKCEYYSGDLASGKWKILYYGVPT